MLEVTYKGKNIWDVLEMTVNQAVEFFSSDDPTERRIVKKLEPLRQVGLGYVKLGQSSSTLSGGESQRVKLAYFLSLEKADPTIFIFDEPTTGLHFHDIRKLLESFDALIRRGHTVIIIEHNMDVIKCADHVIDLGPEGGERGGHLVVCGTPEQVAACPESYTVNVMAEKKSDEKRPFKERLKVFLTKDIWSFDLNRRGPLLRAVGNTVKVVVIAIRTFLDDKIMARAAALTYSTLFAIVPILALIFAVARGLGFENVLNTLIKEGIVNSDSTLVVTEPVMNADSLAIAYNDVISGDSISTAAQVTETTTNETLKTVMQFIDGYMQYVSGGAFVGIGLLFLLWSVYSLADNIEGNLNQIWHIKQARGMGRKITDYFSLIILIPIGIVSLSGLTSFVKMRLTAMEGYLLLGGFVQFLIVALPFLIAGLIFTGFYIFMPNTKVKFKYAVIPGFIAGCLFTVLQNLYFSGQLALSSYTCPCSFSG